MNDTWLEVACELPNELADILAEYLADVSGAGVCVENLNVDAFSPAEITHSPLMTVKAYFSAADDMAARLAEISAFLDDLAAANPGAAIGKPVVATVKSEDWSTSWKANFKPLRVGRRLLIVPSWEVVEAGPDDIVLSLDPGMAFGTGGHETTRLCLEQLEAVLLGRPAGSPPSVLDLGTGSGILAMAAARLGAGRVCAVDIDPDAVEVARENLAINGLAERIECSATPLEALAGPFDVILANILAEELVRLAPQLTERLAAGGVLILSGILAEKEPLVRSGFAAQPLAYRETARQGEWVAMLYRKDVAPA
ncbi:50S ribosomal protein L11 methyltransferase [Geobacter sp. FeAm09]|uniref:50S ribosomal protein L11 methyltransferase n=1 Tax=Geobacter sp. FeAm09 TaxID=2597769 RepID=UPI0011EC520B|nr:50S ribosomal protein L11 methyltransferase [Geobacter sp. FeAm09]QEM67118.1 50S ribosomal protein L11 methyltransferase [Geobacter sp. FeAm09]